MHDNDQCLQHSRSFFSNTACEHFPCHEGVAPEQFNCLFCYCPLYTLGDKCGGNFTYTSKGTKSCVNCSLPHDGERGCSLVQEKWPMIGAMARRKPESEGE